MIQLVSSTLVSTEIVFLQEFLAAMACLVRLTLASKDVAAFSPLLFALSHRRASFSTALAVTPKVSPSALLPHRSTVRTIRAAQSTLARKELAASIFHSSAFQQRNVIILWDATALVPRQFASCRTSRHSLTFVEPAGVTMSHAFSAPS